MRQLCMVTGGANGIGEGIVRRLHDDVRTSSYFVVTAEGPVDVERHCSQEELRLSTVLFLNGTAVSLSRLALRR